MITKRPMTNEIILYSTPEGNKRVGVLYHDENFWLTQKALAGLFNVKVPAVSKHLRNILESGELEEDSVVSILETAAADGKTYKSKYYNLNAIIAVGYQVNSYQATQFRVWATKNLKEFIIKGFVLDDERLKQGKHFGKDYFYELLERIREIRSSERRFHQKITDIYALSADYDRRAPITKEFFAMVEKKLHWVITGKTVADIIYDSADAEKIHIGLTSWKQAPNGKILKSDVSVAKNYLSEAHIMELNRIVTAYLDLAENRAERQIVMKMEDWVDFLHSFLALSNYPILENKGKVSALEAKLKAEQEYETYRERQDREFASDFDREMKRIQSAKEEDDE